MTTIVVAFSFSVLSFVVGVMVGKRNAPAAGVALRIRRRARLETK